ncbi:MAG TPA: hypothetical protein VGM08_03205 [Candidatus Saccharimonadales bacterium]|jgi:hypothetical protein
MEYSPGPVQWISIQNPDGVGVGANTFPACNQPNAARIQPKLYLLLPPLLLVLLLRIRRQVPCEKNEENAIFATKN